MTIQEAIRNCNRKNVIDAYIYKYAFNNYELCINDYDDITVGEIKNRLRKHLNEVMDRICNATPKPSEDREILMAVHTVESEFAIDVDFNLYKADELMDDKYQSYGYEFTPLEETLNFEVANTYLTNYYLNELIATYLFEVTWTGWNQEHLEEEVNEITESAKEVEEHPERLVEWDSEKFREEFELEKEDPKQQRAWRKLIKQQGEYSLKCIEIEVKKWRANEKNNCNDNCHIGPMH